MTKVYPQGQTFCFNVSLNMVTSLRLLKLIRTTKAPSLDTRSRLSHHILTLAHSNRVTGAYEEKSLRGQPKA